ncbi:glycerol-3-phosphate 1-O-acyltransferase PlsY [Dubosiella muris]|uniref:Glycerol-3-phosphate 1-O-acyltransferase PlsY n=3 Tax=Dubosiella TaxID=1937008 RepID=A0AC61R6S6_9FIRM|nr:glycerol-3-phosphate 1-O-acyltransferase PlsY [Dubosiella muris]TGY65863.1 glycerol-3-phosphate 1-O-acyltransferase PlsY [Dubosiella muris]
MNILYSLLCLVLGYLLGSIPFALIIGKLFYHTDIRKHGSGNLGGTNAGRVLGKKAGIAVIVCDVLKVVAALGVASLISPVVATWTGLACCIGHCYPVFAHFHGGKAVSTVFGFLLGMSLFVFKDASFFLVPFAMFFITLYLFKFVSLASICGILCGTLYITAVLWYFNADNILIILACWLMSALVVYRHTKNIVAIRNGEERKISWM